MSCSIHVFQLAGEAQELFSVRHGPVRAARILPAPYISEYLHTSIWISQRLFGLVYNVPHSCEIGTFARRGFQAVCTHSAIVSLL